MANRKYDKLDEALWCQLESEGVFRTDIAQHCGCHTNTLYSRLGPKKRLRLRLLATKEHLKRSAEARRAARRK
jgi:hypothetical protein